MEKVGPSDPELAPRVKTKQWAAFARMIREQVPGQERLPILQYMVSWPDSTTRAEMHDFLVQSEATPDERKVCILAFAQGGQFLEIVKGPPDADAPGGSGMIRKNATTTDLDSFRSWLRSGAPELLEESSAALLNGLLHHMRYGDVVPLALHCHAGGGSDQVLIAVLDSPYAAGDLKLARSVAAKLSDPAKRKEFMKRFNQ